jgi:hypothetical protein
VDLNNSEAVSWIDKRIEDAFHEHQILNPVVFIAKRRSPASITNAAVVEAVTPSPEGEDEVAGDDDSVEVFWVRRQTGSLACEEVADAQVSLPAVGVAVLDGDAAAEGVEVGEAGIPAI